MTRPISKNSLTKMCIKPGTSQNQSARQKTLRFPQYLRRDRDYGRKTFFGDPTRAGTEWMIDTVWTNSMRTANILQPDARFG
ncbi:MAG: hypothetical protein DWH78_15075 [Planctomycetota bacterium]|nr:MAG: hypothetical protein DWH78_15075 [Planctomycetota bacterium]